MEEPTSEQPAASQEPTSSTASKMAKKQPPRVGLRLCAEEDLAWAIETGFIKNYPPEIYHDHMYAWPGQKYQPGDDDDEVDPPKEEMPPILGNSFQNDLMPYQSEIITEQQETSKVAPMKYQISQMDVVDSGTVFQRSAMSHQAASSQGPPILHRAGGITMNDAALASSVGPSQRHPSPTRIPNRQGPPHRNPIGRMVHVSEGARRAIYAPGQPPQQHTERRVQLHFNESPPPTLIPHRQTVPIVPTSPSRKPINFHEHPEHASIQQPIRRPAILRPTERPQARGGIRSNLPGSHHPASESLAQQTSRSPRKEEVLPMEIKNLAHSLRLTYPPSASGTQGEVSPNQQQYKPAMPNDLARGRIHNPRAMENLKSPDMLPAKSFRMAPPGRQPPGAPGSSSLGGGAMIRAPGSSPIRTNLDFNTQMKVMPASSGVKSNLPPKGRQPASPTKSPSKKRVQKKPKDEDDLEEEIEEDEETDDEDDERVNCICKEEDDLEELGWVQCDQCKCWQHAVCGGYDAIVEAKDRYFCHICQPHVNRPNRKTYHQAVEIVKRARLNNKKYQQKGKGPAVNRKPPPEIVRDQPISSPLPSSSTSSRCTLSSGARIWMKNAGAANDFNGPFAYGSCSKLTVAEQTKGLVANQSIPRGTAVSEIVAHVCKPTEIHSDLDNLLIFKYNRLNISQMPHSKTTPEKVILCLDTRKVAHDGRAVRRCCRPNSTIRHRLSAVLPNFYIVTRQDIEKREEITIAFDSGYRPNRNECRCYGVDDANCLLNDPTFIGPGFMENAAPPVASLPPASPVKNRRREKNEAKVKEEKSEEETPIEPKPATSRQRTISRSPIKSPRREEREMRPPPSPSRRISERAGQVQEETEPTTFLPSSSKKPVFPKKAKKPTPKGELSPPASSANKPVERTEPGPSKKVKKPLVKEAKPSTSHVAPAPEAEQPKQEETPKEKKKPVGGRRNELDSLNQFNTNFAVPSGSTDREKRKLQQELARFGGKTPITKKTTPKEKPKKSIESEKKSSKIKEPAEIKIEVILPEDEETTIQPPGPGSSKKSKKSISESSSAIAPGPSSSKNVKVKAEPEEEKSFAAESKKSTESEETPLSPPAGSSKKAKSQIASPPPEEKLKAASPEGHKPISPKPSSSKKSKIRAISPLLEEEKIEPSSKKSKTTAQEVQSSPPAKIEKTRRSRAGSPPPKEEKPLEKFKPEEPTGAGPSKKSSTRAPPPEESLKPDSSKKSKQTIPLPFEEKPPGPSSPKKSKAKAEPEDAPESSKKSKLAKRQAPEPIPEESLASSAGPSGAKKVKPEEEKEIPSGKVKSTPKAKEPLFTPIASSSKEKKKEKETPKNKALEKVAQEAGNRTPQAPVVPATPASSARPVRNRIPTQKIKERENSLRAEGDRIGSLSRDATPASKARTPAPGPSAVARTKQPKASKTNQSEGTNADSVWKKLRTGFEQSSKKDFTLFEYLKPTPKAKKSPKKTTKKRREKPQKKKFMRDHLHELFNSSKKRRATKKATKVVKKQQLTRKVNTNRSQRVHRVPGRYRTST